MFDRRRDGAALLLLALLTAGVYLLALNCDFVDYDDGLYVTSNPTVQHGLTLHGLVWAFTTGYANNWHPLTWLSHMLDCQLYGLNPRGHHATNLMLHAANTLLLFWFLRRATGARIRSLLVAALFAVHPLHVESVAWVAERKDLLSGLFFMLALIAYRRYVELPRWGRYSLVAAAFVFGLLSKPMIVTLPCVLLLLDYWPLRREGTSAVRLVIEKLPLFALAAASSVITFIVQARGGSVIGLERIPLLARIENVPLAYAGYLRNTFLPEPLAVFYPHPGADASLAAVLVCAAILLGITILAFRFGRRARHVPVGWLWYLGMLVPVIGIVQAGLQSMADRYTYLPLIGVFIVLVWELGDLAGDSIRARRALTCIAAIAIAALSLTTIRQIQYWKNPFTLFEHAIAVIPNNTQARMDLGQSCLKRDMYDKAAEQFAAVLRTDPRRAEAHAKLGSALRGMGRNADAIREYESALALNTDDVSAMVSLGMALCDSGDIEHGAQWFSKALSVEPANSDAHYSLAVLLYRQGRYSEAVQHFAEVVRAKPEDADAWYKLGLALLQQGRRRDAANAFTRVLQIQPGHAAARDALQSLDGQS